MGFFDDAISSIGKSLATSATSYLTETTGYDVGGTMAFLFGNGQTTKGETLSALNGNITAEFTGNAVSLTLLQNDLNNQTVQIGLIGDQLTAMATAIQDINGEIKGLEALLRWRHPEHGVLHPTSFLADAEPRITPRRRVRGGGRRKRRVCEDEMRFDPEDTRFFLLEL